MSRKMIDFGEVEIFLYQMVFVKLLTVILFIITLEMKLKSYRENKTNLIGPLFFLDGNLEVHQATVYKKKRKIINFITI